VAYFSKALMSPERNYNVWDQEFLAIVAALHHWRHLLIGIQEPVMIFTNHANLQYYRHLQKINRRVARYINFLEDFNYQLKHIPGKKNRADALSCHPDHDDSTGDNEHVVALPNEVFTNMMSMAALDQAILAHQKRRKAELEEWKDKYQLEYKDKAWYKGRALVVADNEEDQWSLLKMYHDAPTAGHLSMAKMLQALSQDYW